MVQDNVFGRMAVRFGMCALGVGLPGAAFATTITPSGLAAGSTYRLAFVTSGTTTATASDAASYNAFVQAAATTAGLGGTWSAIVSTATVNAIDNVACTPSCANDPIYLVNGTEVTDNTNDLFNSSLMNAINIDENGNQASFFAYVWTGTQPGGTAAQPDQYSDGGPVGSADPTRGVPGSGDAYLDIGSDGAGVSNSLFALSSELTVPGTAVPEPASLALLALGVAGTAAARRRGA